MASAWTEARLKNFIISGLRSLTRRYPPKNEVRKEAFTEKRINTKTKRLASHYACAKCKKDFPAKETQVDHIIPVVDPGQGFVDWNTYIPRMFCPKENLQLLCTKCHDIKTLKETKRKSTRLSKQPKAKSSLKAKSVKKNSTSSLNVD